MTSAPSFFIDKTKGFLRKICMNVSKALYLQTTIIPNIKIALQMSVTNNLSPRTTVLRCILFFCILFLTQPISAQDKRYHGDGVDEVLQYVPLASVYTLKALGVKNESSWKRLVINSAVSFTVNAGVTYALKHTVHSTRPDGTDNRSFPSGHTSIAFCGATVLHKEYGKTSPWISVAGYSVATLTAIDRVRRNRHHWGDVLAGAAIGVLSTEAGYRLGDLLNKERKTVDVAVMPTGFQLIVNL